MRIQHDSYKRGGTYAAFANTLNEMYEWEKTQPRSLRWVGVDPNVDTDFIHERFPPRPVIDVGSNLPTASVRVVGFDNDGKAIGEAYAPLLMRDVRPLMANGGDPLLRYPLTRLLGSQKSPTYHTIGEIFEAYRNEDGYQLIQETPLVEVIALVPIGEKDSGFTTQFAPEMRADGSFALPLIVEDAMACRTAVLNQRESVRHLMYPDKDGSESFFKARFVPDMDAVERWGSVNDQTGHMIVIARPIYLEQNARPIYLEQNNDPANDGYNLNRLLGGSGPVSRKALDLGRVKIEQGVSVGNSRPINTGNKTDGLIGVYHFRVIGVRSRKEFQDKLGNVEEALSLGL